MNCRIKRMARIAGKYMLCFVALIAVFVLLMTLVICLDCIPNLA